MPALPQITDEDLVKSAPTVRALLVGRLEQMWRPIQAGLELSAAAGVEAIPMDPRLLEIGIRIVEREAALYGITRPRPAAPEEEVDAGLDPAVDRRALVEARISEIEARMKSQAESD